MSVTSAQTDASVRYQRLATDYVKARSQVSVLKAAVIEEKETSGRLRNELQAKEVDVRKFIDENEGLLFRNSQLLKRVEALQTTLDEVHRLHAAKGKKVSVDVWLLAFIDVDIIAEAKRCKSSSVCRSIGAECNLQSAWQVCKLVLNFQRNKNCLLNAS